MRCVCQRPHISAVPNCQDFTDVSSRGSKSQNRVQKKIIAGQQVLRRMRLQVGVTMIVLGLLMGTLYEYLLWDTIIPTLHAIHTAHHNFIDCDPALHMHLQNAAMSFLGMVRIILIALAPVADDMCITKMSILLEVLILLASLTQVFPFFVYSPINGAELVVRILVVLSSLVYISGCAWAFAAKEAQLMQKRMWSCIMAYFLLDSLKSITFTIELAIVCKGVPNCIWQILTNSLAIYISCHPQVRFALQSKVNKIFVMRSKERAAAGIACLVGDCSAHAALTEAASRFRVTTLQDISFDDVSDNKPNPLLFARSSMSRLRQCDAFVSHSWSDVPEAKWSALQSWRAEFVAANGREPRIWFDKCCINQTQVDADLRCLPIFLSGCRSLLVLSGVTYLSRLWCVMEIFTYVHMGGRLEQIRLLPVLRKDQEYADQLEINTMFEDFDAKHSTCFLDTDKIKLLGIIHSAFGSLGAFNEVVRNMFEEIGWDTSSVSAKSSDTGSSSSEDDDTDES